MGIMTLFEYMKSGKCLWTFRKTFHTQAVHRHDVEKSQ